MEKKKISEDRRKKLHIYGAKYRKETQYRLMTTINKKTDKDIIAKLESVNNKTEYIKDLIRQDIERSKQ